MRLSRSRTRRTSANAAAKYGLAYFLTVTEDGRPHAVAVTPTLAVGELYVEGVDVIR